MCEGFCWSTMSIISHILSLHRIVTNKELYLYLSRVIRVLSAISFKTTNLIRSLVLRCLPLFIKRFVSSTRFVTNGLTFFWKLLLVKYNTKIISQKIQSIFYAKWVRGAFSTNPLSSVSVDWTFGYSYPIWT